MLLAHVLSVALATAGLPEGALERPGEETGALNRSFTPRLEAPPPLSLLWAPLLVPASLVMPGVGHLSRGDGRGWAILTAASSAFIVTIASVMAIGISGAADSVSAVAIPLALISVSTFLSLGTADAIGAFSAHQAHVAAGIRSEAWNARGRLGVGYVLSPDPVLRQAHYLQANGMIRLREMAFDAYVASDPRGGDLILAGGASHRLFALDRGGALIGEGIWLDANVRREWNDRARFNLTSLALSVRWEVPLLLFLPTLSRVSAELRLGIRPLFGSFHGGGRTATSEISGGYEVRWAVTDWIRPYWGYEHARDRFVGGEGTGFYGSFYGGAEVQLAERLFLDVRGLLGTPETLQSNVEWRW